MFRNIVIVVLSFVFCVCGEAVSQEQPQLAVSLYNDAGAPESVVKRAQQITSYIYRRVGVTIAWSGPGDVLLTPTSAAEMRKPSPSLGSHVGFSIRILSGSLSLQGDDFGVAFVGSDGLGVQADVFYSNIERLRRAYSIDPGEILGYVMAHELGHLLLGPKSHSKSGIMQAHWASRQLHEISMGYLGFDKHEMAIMRTRLHSGYATMKKEEARESKPNLITASLPRM